MLDKFLTHAQFIWRKPMKPYIFALAALTITHLSVDASAQCITQPSCENLGYTLTSTSDCIGTALKCPFENKYNCITKDKIIKTITPNYSAKILISKKQGLTGMYDKGPYIIGQNGIPSCG